MYWEPMVLILAGNSDIGAHARRISVIFDPFLGNCLDREQLQIEFFSSSKRPACATCSGVPFILQVPYQEPEFRVRIWYYFRDFCRLNKCLKEIKSLILLHIRAPISYRGVGSESRSSPDPGP